MSHALYTNEILKAPTYRLKRKVAVGVGKWYMGRGTLRNPISLHINNRSLQYTMAYSPCWEKPPTRTVSNPNNDIHMSIFLINS